MVRTRATRVKPGSQDSAVSIESQDSGYSSRASEDKQLRLLIAALEKQFVEKLRRLEEAKSTAFDDIQKRHDLILMSIGPFYGDMLLRDFLKLDVVSCDPEYDSFIKPKAVTSKCRDFATSTTRKARDSPPPPSPPAGRITRQSRQRSLARSTSEDNLSMIVAEEIPRIMQKPTRRTRSTSNHRSAHTSIYTTPATKSRPLTAVTPKVDPATAALKRHPRQGEFAMSLTGSPLMIPQPSSEANITVPLSNGEIYSILPTDNFVVGPIPALSEDTRRQILQLRKNLDRLLKK